MDKRNEYVAKLLADHAHRLERAALELASAIKHEAYFIDLPKSAVRERIRDLLDVAEDLLPGILDARQSAANTEEANG